MKKILFIGEDLTLAHLSRPLELAKSLGTTDFELVFATGNKYLPFLQNLDFKTVTVKTLSSEIFLKRLAKGEPIFKKKELRTEIDEDFELISQYKPDLIVGDFRLSLGISATIAKIPYICLTNAFWSPFSRLRFPVADIPIAKLLGVKTIKKMLPFFLPYILWYHARPINFLRKEYNLQPYKNVKEAYCNGDWNLYLDPPSLAPTKNLPDNHRYIGPLLWEPDDSLPIWWNDLPNDKPIIYLTLGSSGDISSIAELINTLNKYEVSVVVSSAGRFTNDLFDSKVYVEPFLPGDKVASQASMVVCSGGTATTYQALSRGTPVIGIPCNTDQYLSMEAIERQGSGILIRSGSINTLDFRLAVEQILNDDKFRQRAQLIKNEIEIYQAPKLFKKFIKTLVGYEG